MKELQKQRTPAILEANAGEWTRAYVEAAHSDRPRHEKWRHKQIKEALERETHQRCAYCEAFVADVAYPTVEHIVPKSISPELAHHWPNLTYCCGRCNTQKGDYYSTSLPVINPYVDKPSDHIRFLGPLVDYCLGSILGQVTIKKLDLNRLELAHTRRLRIEAIRALVDRWHASSGEERTFFEEGIRLDVAEGEFPAAVTAYLRAYEFPI